MEEPPRAERGTVRVRAFLGGTPVLDTLAPVLVWEWPFYPTWFVPAGDVDDDVLARLDPGAVTRHRLVVDGVPTDLVRVAWDAVDRWFAEDEPVEVHPRDPGVRIDVLSSSRHVVAAVDGVTFLDSRRPSILYETRLPPRFYVPLVDVRMDLLRPSATVTHCPYKGAASYWSLEVGGVTHRDLLWTYPSPLPESQKVAGLVAVWTEAVDLWLDGVAQERPVTHFERPGA